MKKYNLEPSCYDAFLENHIYDNRMLTLSEQINMMKRDIRLASLLGFKNLRTLVSTPMDVIEGSLEYAEQMNVKIGLEVHAPFSLNSGWADGYMEMIHRTGTKYFGFIPDMGIFCKNIPDVVRDKARRHGASEECIKIVDDAYAQRIAKGFTKIKYDLDLGKANMEYRMQNGMKEMMDAVQAAGGGPADMEYAGSIELPFSSLGADIASVYDTLNKSFRYSLFSITFSTLPSATVTSTIRYLYGLFLSTSPSSPFAYLSRPVNEHVHSVLLGSYIFFPKVR